MNNVQGTKKYAGSALAALLIFGAVAAVIVVPQTAYAAVTITSSADTFFGPSLMRFEIKDDALVGTPEDAINVLVEARRGTTSLGTVTARVTEIGSSGNFELFVTTSDFGLQPANPTFTTGSGHTVRINTAPNIGGDTNDFTIDLNGGAGAEPTAELRSGDTVVITYGGQSKTVNFSRSTAVLSSDRTVAGSGNQIVLSINDKDANTDPTAVDSFPAVAGIMGSGVTYATAPAAAWTETGQNTGIFELTINVNSPATTADSFITETLPTGKSFTVTDHDVYEVIGGSVAPFNALVPRTSTTSASVTLQNSNAALSQLGATTLAGGLSVQINDADRNVGTQTEDDVLGVSTLGGTQAQVISAGGGTTSQTLDLSGITLTTTGATTGFIVVRVNAELSSVATLSIETPTSTVAPGGTITFGTLSASVSPGTSSSEQTITYLIPFTTTGAEAGTSLGTISATLTLGEAATVTPTTTAGSPNVTQLIVTVDGVAGVVDGVTFTETGDSTGIFLADLTDGVIPISVGSGGVTSTGIVLSLADINNDPDITFTYRDPAVNTGSTTFSIITSLAHTSGVIEPVQSSVGVSDNFSLMLTDPDLNTDSATIQTYTLTTGTPKNKFVIGGETVATLELKSKGTQRDLEDFGQTITFIETGPNTGEFMAQNLQMTNVNAYSALSDGDQVEFTYDDLMESPSVDSDATITVGKPSTAISADKTTVPVPTAGTTTKVTIEVTDPSVNLNSGSVETISIPTSSITVTPRSGITTVGLTSFTGTGNGLNQAQTLTETGPNTGVFTKTIDLTKSGAVADADYEGAKIKFTYGSSSTTVTLKTYDATITTDKANVKNGDTVVITVTDLDMNKDPSTAEQVTGSFTVQGKSDDQTLVTVTLTETGPNTGVFTKSLVVGKDFKVSALPTGATAGTTSTSVEMKYTETITSDRNAGVIREKSVKVGTATGMVELTPSLIGPGTKFTIRVTDSDLNVNPEGVDSVASATTADWVKITSDASGTATSTVGLEETGANTGVFEATVQLSPRASGVAGVFTASDFDHAFTALPGDILSVRYTDQKDTSGNKVVVSKTFLVTSVDPTMTADTSVAAGNTITLTVEDADANLDGDAQDSIRIRVTSDSDSVGLELSALETEINSGIFTVQIPTTTSVSAGSITVKTSDSIYLKYSDTYPADYADRVKQVVDPSKDFTYVVLVGTPGGDPESTSPTAPVLKDISGNTLSEVSAGSQVILSSTITNNADFSQPFAGIVEVRDADGFTVMLQWQTGVLNANGTTEIGISWTPDAPGEYTVRTFVLTSIQNPGILSPIEESTVTVS